MTLGTPKIICQQCGEEKNLCDNFWIFDVGRIILIFDSKSICACNESSYTINDFNKEETIRNGDVIHLPLDCCCGECNKKIERGDTVKTNELFHLFCEDCSVE